MSDRPPQPSRWILSQTSIRLCLKSSACCTLSWHFGCCIYVSSGFRSGLIGGHESGETNADVSCLRRMVSSRPLWSSRPIFQQPIWSAMSCMPARFTHLLNPVYTIQPVVNPVVQPDWQPAVWCKQTSNRLSNRLSNGLYNRFDNRLYRVNGALRTAFLKAFQTNIPPRMIYASLSRCLVC